jgi:hypothetical protein
LADGALGASVYTFFVGFGFAAFAAGFLAGFSFFGFGFAAAALATGFLASCAVEQKKAVRRLLR